MSVRRPLLALTAAGVLAAPAQAQAAPALSVDRTCYASKAGDGSRAVPPIRLAGQGFTPNAPVSIMGHVLGSATADATGAFIMELTVPVVTTYAPKTMTVTATEPANPAGIAQVSFPVVRDVFAVNAPISGRPNQTTTWRFAGFTEGKGIYGHFRFRGDTKRNYRYGTAKGPCGTLVVRARRVPVRVLLRGDWTAKFDQARTYRRSSPGRLVGFRIFRTFRFG